MPHPPDSIPIEVWRNVVIFLGGVLFSLFGWLGGRHIKRLDKIESNYVSKEDIKTLRGAIDSRFDDLLRVIERSSK